MGTRRRRRGLSLNQILAIVIAVLLTVMIGMLIVLIAGSPDAPNPEETLPQTTAPQIPEEPTAAPTQATEAVEEVEIPVQTPYITLSIPAELGEYLHWEEQQAEDVYCLAFLARFSDIEDVPLFELCIGPNLENPMGEFVTPEGTVLGWSLAGDEIALDESWSLEQAALIYQMRETIHDLETQLGELEKPPVVEETLPEETQSEETLPEETLPEETLPEETLPEDTIPEETAPEEAESTEMPTFPNSVG